MSATEVSAVDQISRVRDEVNKPWWRYPIVWLVIGGPLVVVVASLITAFIAAHGQDPVLMRDESAGAVEVRNGTESMTPAEAARNHAATPRHP